jgi:hypothetical protein
MMRLVLLPLMLANTLFVIVDIAAASMSDSEPSQVSKSQPVVRLMAPNTEAQLRKLLPRVDNAQVQRTLDDPRLILYTDREMPKAYQFWNGFEPGVHSVNYNISANRSEPFGNGNREFPWAHPAGTHRTTNVWSFKFLQLPEDASGNFVPIVWFRTRGKTDGAMGYAWRFPVGAVLGEVLVMRGEDGADYCFELRIRTREQEDWAPEVFRPFPRARDLVDRIQELRPKWLENAKLRSFIELLSSPADLPVRELSDKHPQRTIRQKMGVFVLPPLDDTALVSELLTTTVFKSSLHEYWFEGASGILAAAPTTQSRFHVVPANYDAGFIEVDHVSCIRCHETVNQSVDRFQAGRDWYGRIRGSDGIFSFHPFDPNSISPNGYSRPVAMRRELMIAGVIQAYSPDKHDYARYAQVPHLVE